MWRATASPTTTPYATTSRTGIGPNLRAKNRDGATVLGPWFVDAADVPIPANLDLRTFVNGRQTQQGNTRDLIFDIPYLIEYLSSFMTLSPGRCDSHRHAGGRGRT